MNLRKLCPVFGLICVSLFTTANAQPYNHSDSSDQKNNYREITPSAGPRVAGGADIFMDVDFIWWNACQEGKEYLTSSEVMKGAKGSNWIKTDDSKYDDSKVPVNSDLNADGGVPKIYRVDFSKKTETNITEKWSPGFKVGLGLNLGHDGWDMALRYTWLNPSVTNSLDPSSFNLLNAAGKALVTEKKADPSTSGDVKPGMINQVSSKYDLDYNTLDLELARNSYFSQYLQCRLFSGLKGVWQNQNSAITAMPDKDSVFRLLMPKGATYSDMKGDGALFDSYKVHEVMKIGGIGLRTGFNLLFLMSKSVGLYSDVALTGMWVRYRDLSRKDTLSDSADKDGSKDVVTLDAKKGGNKDNNYDTVKGITELGLGLLWQSWMLDDRYHVAFKAGFEQQIWHNWGTGFKADGSSMPWADFKTYGLKLNLRFDF